MAKRKAKRVYTQSPVVVDTGIECPHCHEMYDHRVRDKKNTSTGPRWYMKCAMCGRNFVLIRPKNNS